MISDYLRHQFPLLSFGPVGRMRQVESPCRTATAGTLLTADSLLIYAGAAPPPPPPTGVLIEFTCKMSAKVLQLPALQESTTNTVAIVNCFDAVQSSCDVLSGQ